MVSDILRAFSVCTLVAAELLQKNLKNLKKCLQFENYSCIIHNVLDDSDLIPEKSTVRINGLSPNGKALDSDSSMWRFESS